MIINFEYYHTHFEFKSLHTQNFQNVAIVTYPQEEGYTRITEYSKMTFQECNGWTNATYEYPVSYNKNAQIAYEPRYPSLTEDSIKMYDCYKKFAQEFENLILCGRLADFKYYNMDQVILRTLQLYETMEN